MLDIFDRIFDTSDFTPRWDCGNWSTVHGWLHITSDVAIFAAYAAIPIVLALFAWRRRDIPFLPIFWLFAGFILFCGAGHLIDASVFWRPWYRLSAIVKLATAVISWGTVFALVRIAPHALALPGLARVNQKLQEEIRSRQAAEEQFRELADAMPQIVWAARPDGHIDYYNERWYKFTGFEHGERNNWTPILHPDDVPRRQAAWQRSVATGEPYEVQYRFHDRVTGDLRWHLGRALPVLDDMGRIVRWYGTSTDIDDMKRAEQDRAYLATIVESSNDAIVGKDLEGFITAWNGGAERLFGYKAAEAVGRSIIFLLPPGREHEEAAILARVRQGQRIEHFESVRLAKDGRLIDVSLTISPIKDTSGRIVGISKIARDITEKKQAEAAIRQWNGELERRVEIRTAELAVAKEAAEAAAKAKSQFLANVSHEIRSPMNAILGMTELTLDTPLSPLQRENLEIVKSGTETLLVLVEDLLDFSRIEAGKVELDPMPLELRALLGDTLNLLALRAESKGLELALFVHPDVPDRLIGDPGRLRQILVNLIGNAIKFTEKGDVVVEVQSKSCIDNAAELQFSVRDTGIGIPSEKHAIIFQPFVQADGSTTRRYGGTGLGLSISSQLIELMGGRIWVDSKVGQGSTFHFTARFGTEACNQHDQLRAIKSLRGVRTLVVDDNAASRRVLSSMLSSWGMHVTLASNGKEALAALLNARDYGVPIAVIILDVQMPDMDGFAVVERMRDDPACQSRVILMQSSINKQTMVDRCRALGISTYLQKPIREDELRQLLQKLIEPAAAQEPEPIMGRTASPLATHRPLHVLVAEDNPHNQRVVGLMLSKLGHMATVAETGREVVALWGRESFDLVLMDVQMPDMDGLKATALIRKAEAGRDRRTPIIAMTAYARKEDRARCLAAGMDGYISKPLKADDLRAVIEQCLTARTPPAVCPADDLSLKVWDQEAALARVDGDRNFLRQMASMFVRKMPDLMTEIRDAIRSAEPTKIGVPAHALKNWLDNFVASRAVEVAQALQSVGISGDVSAATSALEALERETECLGRELERFASH